VVRTGGAGYDLFIGQRLDLGRHRAIGLVACGGPLIRWKRKRKGKGNVS
jgi:hypothetical protein